MTMPIKKMPHVVLWLGRHCSTRHIITTCEDIRKHSKTVPPTDNRIAKDLVLADGVSSLDFKQF